MSLFSMAHYNDQGGVSGATLNETPSWGKYLGTVVEDTFASGLTNKLSANIAQAVPDDSPIISAEQAAQKYGIDGELKFDSPIRESAAQFLHDRKMDEIGRKSVLMRGTSAQSVVGVPTALAASLLDPIEDAAMFIPVGGWLGKIKALAPVSRFLQKSTITSRFALGALEGGTGALMLEPARVALSSPLQDDYTMADGLLNVAFGSVLGGGLHVAGGVISDVIGKGFKRFEPKSEKSRLPIDVNTDSGINQQIADSMARRYSEEDLQGVVTSLNENSINAAVKSVSDLRSKSIGLSQEDSDSVVEMANKFIKEVNEYYGYQAHPLLEKVATSKEAKTSTSVNQILSELHPAVDSVSDALEALKTLKQLKAERVNKPETTKPRFLHEDHGLTSDNAKQAALTTAVGDLANDVSPRSESIVFGGSNLTPEEISHAKKFSSDYEKNKQAVLGKYEQRFGNEVSSDNARKIYEPYDVNAKSRQELSNATWNTADKIANDVYENALKKPKKDGKGLVIFNAGGQGSGKTTSLHSSGIASKAGIVVDGTMQNFHSSVDKIQSALNSGRRVAINYVYRNFDDAVKSIIERAADSSNGRIVTMRGAARGHYGALESILQIAEKFKGDERVKIRAFDNTNFSNKEISLKDLSGKRYESIDSLINRANSILDEQFAANRGNPAYTEDLYNRLKSNPPRRDGSHVDGRSNGNVGQDDFRGNGQGGEGEGGRSSDRSLLETKPLFSHEPVKLSESEMALIPKPNESPAEEAARMQLDIDRLDDELSKLSDLTDEEKSLLQDAKQEVQLAQTKEKEGILAGVACYLSKII